MVKGGGKIQCHTFLDSYTCAVMTKGGIVIPHLMRNPLQVSRTDYSIMDSLRKYKTVCTRKDSDFRQNDKGSQIILCLITNKPTMNILIF